MDLGSIFGATTGAVGSLFSGIASRKNTKETNRTNLQIAQETNDTSLAMARDNNALQERMNRYNNEFSRDVALEMFNLENAYNTPSAQKKRLLEAGINPYALASEGAVVAGSGDAASPSAATSGISPSMPSLSTPRMETPPSVLSTMFSSLDVLSRAMASKSQSSLSDSENKQINLLMNETIKQSLEETKNKQLQNAMNELQLSLERLYGSSQRDANLHKTMQEVTKLYEDTIVAQLQQDNVKSQKLLNDANAALTNSNNSVVKAQAPFIIKQAEETVKLIKEQQNTQKSIQTSNYSSAAESRSRADLTDEQTYQLKRMREDNVRLNQLLKEGRELDVDKMRRSLDSQIQYLKNLGLLSEEQIKQTKHEADLKAKDNESYYGRLLMDMIDKALSIALKGTAFYSYFQ